MVLVNLYSRKLWKRTYQRAYRKRPEAREKHNAYLRERWRRDPLVRKRRGEDNLAYHRGCGYQDLLAYQLDRTVGHAETPLDPEPPSIRVRRLLERAGPDYASLATARD